MPQGQEKSLNFSEAFNFAKDNIGKYFVILLLINLVYTLGPNAIAFLFKMIGLQPVGAILGGIASLLMVGGFMQVFVTVAEEGMPEISYLFQKPGFFLRFLLAGIIIGIGAALGLLLLIVPGVIFILHTCFTFPLMVDRDCGAIEAIKLSSELSKGTRLKLLGFGALVFLMLFFVTTVSVFIAAIPAVAMSFVMHFKPEDVGAFLGALINPFVMIPFQLLMANCYLQLRNQSLQTGHPQF